MQLANTSNFICDHQGFCHPNCYERQRRSCARLIAASQRIYGSGPEDARPAAGGGSASEEAGGGDFNSVFRDKLKRRVSETFLVRVWNGCVLLSVSCLMVQGPLVNKADSPGVSSL